MSPETFKKNQQIMSIPDFIYTHPFDDAIERLIMCRIWMSGSSDCMGVRYLSRNEFASFCCCSTEELDSAIGGGMVLAGHIGIAMPNDESHQNPHFKGKIGYYLKPEWQTGECDDF